MEVEKSMGGMRMMLKVRILGFAVPFAIMASFNSKAFAVANQSGCLEVVAAFAEQPTEATFAALAKIDRDDCWTQVESSNSIQDQVHHWAGQGNRWAALYLAKHLKQLDGGNLEDALVALGQFSDHDMLRILRFAKEGLISKRELTDILTMLPLSLNDKPRAQLDLIHSRERKIIHVNRKSLLEQKILALRAIHDFASEIQSKNTENNR